jgi:uncharacterized protein DUF1036
MADMTVRILLPVDGRILTVDLDDTVTVKELINELLTSGHLTSSPSDYRLSKKVGELLANDVKIRDLGLTANDVLSLTSAPAAGDSPPPPPVSGVPAPQWRSAMAVPAIVILLLLIGSALFLYEQQTYYAARGNAALLNSYLRNCIICTHKTEAVQEENSLQESAAARDQEQNQQQTSPPASDQPSVAQQQASQSFQFEVCNNGCTPASVAVSYYSPGSAAWVTQGWWTVSGNQCKTVGSFTKGPFYYYAKGFYSDAVEWRGNFGLCVKLPGPFLTTNRGLQCRPGELKQFISQNVQSDNYRWSIQSFCE